MGGYNSCAPVERDGIKQFLTELGKSDDFGNVWLSEGFRWGRAAE